MNSSEGTLGILLHNRRKRVLKLANKLGSKQETMASIHRKMLKFNAVKNLIGL